MPNKVITAIKENKDNIRKKLVIAGVAVLGVVAAGFVANKIANGKQDEFVLVLEESTDSDNIPVEN